MNSSFAHSMLDGLHATANAITALRGLGLIDLLGRVGENTSETIGEGHKARNGQPEGPTKQA